MISFALPRFCDQSLDRSRKERFYPGADAVDCEARYGRARAVSHRSGAWPASAASSGRTAPTRRTATASSSSSRSRTWSTHISTAGPIPAVYDFLRDDFAALDARYGGVVGTSFRTFPSFPQRYIERLADAAACEADADGVEVEPLRAPHAADALHRRRSAHPPVHEATRRAGSCAKGESPRRLSAHSTGRVARRQTAAPSSSTLRCSTRTTPVELGAWTNSSPPIAIADMRRVPASVVAKKTSRPARRSSGSTRLPARNCSRTSRGKRDAVLREHVLGEPAAVESGRIACRHSGTACRAATARRRERVAVDAGRRPPAELADAAPAEVVRRARSASAARTRVARRRHRERLRDCAGRCARRR